MSLRRADLSSRGVLPSVCVSLSVIKEAHRGRLVPLGLSSHKKKQGDFNDDVSYLISCPIIYSIEFV